MEHAKYQPMNPEYTGPIDVLAEDAAEIGHYAPRKHREMLKFVSPAHCPTCRGNSAMTEFCPVCDKDCGCVDAR